MKIRTVFASLCVLVIIFSLALGCSNGKNTTIPQVTLGRISLHTPDLSGWFDKTSFNDPSFAGYISVEVIPNDKTVPNERYLVSLFYEGQLIGKGYAYWDNKAFVPGFLTGIDYKGQAEMFRFPIPKTHEVYKAYFEQYNKPVSERHFDIQDYVYVTVTK